MADDAWDERLRSDPAVSSALFPECTSEHHPLVDDLALVAVGERLPGDLERHILECPPCLEAAAAWAELADLAAIGNSTADIPPPGDDVWSAIGAELTITSTTPGPGADGSGGQPGSAASAGTVTTDPITDPTSSHPTTTDSTATASTTTASTTTASTAAHPTLTDLAAGGPRPVAGEAAVVPFPARRPLRAWLVPAAAAVVGIGLAVGAAVVAQQPDESQLQAVADLSVVPGGPLSGDGNLGSAELMRTTDGQLVRVSVADLPAGARSYEVWLFDGNGDMVSLGSLHDGQGVFVVPAGVNTADFRTVDVSDEPGDGNPAHSGISVVRGTFT